MTEKEVTLDVNGMWDVVTDIHKILDGYEPREQVAILSLATMLCQTTMAMYGMQSLKKAKKTKNVTE